MMMNDFGTPMTEADINMSANPAKAMLDQQLATSGIENNIFGAVIGAVTSVIGGRKQAKAASSSAKKQNEQVKKQYKYDVKKWNMDKQAAKAKRLHIIEEIKARKKNEELLAAYKDATNLQNYNLQLEIRNRQQDLNDRMYQRSEQIYKDRLKINAEEKIEALRNQYQLIDEINTEDRYEQQNVYLDTLIAEGQIRALGQTGRGADKALSVKALEEGTKITLLGLSHLNATKASQSAINDIGRAADAANLDAAANRMLDPGTLPTPPPPIATPVAEYVFPRAFEAFDFGPKPIKGAMASPSAAASAVWGSTISSIAGTATSAFLNYGLGQLNAQTG
tara:strand:- start:2183 stop:3190 length:1008 start_codon:yes stop_codon:yes gene_type:complete